MHSEESRPIRILIVDEHKILRDALRALIESNGEMRVVGEAGSREEACAEARRCMPDVILLELSIGGASSLELLPAFHADAPDARIVILTGTRDEGQHQRAVMLGAMGLVLKEQSGDLLLRAIRKVHGGETWLDHTTTANLIQRFTRPRKPDGKETKIALLTDREREIIAVVCEGLKNPEIARRLFISEATVRNHLTSILGKLGLSDRFELALFSYEHGLASLPPNKAP